LLRTWIRTTIHETLIPYVCCELESLRNTLMITHAFLIKNPLDHQVKEIQTPHEKEVPYNLCYKITWYLDLIINNPRLLHIKT